MPPLQSKEVFPGEALQHLCILRFLEKVWLWAGRGLLSHHPGPMGLWPLPSAIGLNALGRSSETVEGHEGREEFCSPAQLASGIESDCPGLISSVNCRLGSLGQLLPWGRELVSKNLAHPFLFQSSSYCFTMCLGN